MTNMSLHPPIPPSDSAEGALRFGAGAVTAAAVEAADPLVLMAAVARLTPAHLERLCEGEAEAFVIACERVIGAVHARQSLAMDTLAGRVEERLERQREDRPLPLGVPGPDVHGTVASMLAPSLHCSTRAVRKRLESDRWLVCAAESTFSTQWQGELERFRADVVADASADLDPSLRETFEALVLETSLDPLTGELTLISPGVRQLSRAQLERRARAVARELDPQSHERAARRAHADRQVVVAPDRRRPGMARWHVLMPTEVSQEVYAAVDALAAQYARSQPGTPIDGHRADALADLVLANAQVQTTVELVVPVLAARGRDTGEAPGDVAAAWPWPWISSTPCWLHSPGPRPASTLPRCAGWFPAPSTFRATAPCCPPSLPSSCPDRRRWCAWPGWIRTGRSCKIRAPTDRAPPSADAYGRGTGPVGSLVAPRQPSAAISTMWSPIPWA